MQPVGDDADIVVRHAWYAVGIVGGEFLHRPATNVVLVSVVWLVTLQYAVALMLDYLFRLQYREVEWCCQFSIFPWLTPLHVEDVGGVVWH